MWVLYSKNRELKGKLISEKKKFAQYKKQVEDLKTGNQNPIKTFEKLNEIVRNFLNDYFGFNYSLTYLELEAKFKEQGNPNYSQFCKMMSDINYSGEKADEAEIDKLINAFYKLLQSYD